MDTLQSRSELKPIQLAWNERQVVVTSEDQDRFVKEAKWAVTACQGFLQIERFVKRFTEELLAKLRAWCERHSDRVSHCYMPLGSSSYLQVYVISATVAFDFQLSDILSELEQTLDNEGWTVDIIQLPQSTPEMLFSYFDPSQSILVYGNGSGTSGEGSS